MTIKLLSCHLLRFQVDHCARLSAQIDVTPTTVGYQLSLDTRPSSYYCFVVCSTVENRRPLVRTPYFKKQTYRPTRPSENGDCQRFAEFCILSLKMWQPQRLLALSSFLLNSYEYLSDNPQLASFSSKGYLQPVYNAHKAIEGLDCVFNLSRPNTVKALPNEDGNFPSSDP